MTLSQMQDLGGCRAVVGSIPRVHSLVSIYEHERMRAVEFVRRFDYIESPKTDGYRSVHLVYRYRGKNKAYDGLKIEIQIRSRPQHAWATAVETIDAFTGQALKSNLGSPAWQRFFALVGTAIALREGCPVVPDTPAKLTEVRAELLDLCAQLRVMDTFEGLRAGLEVAPTVSVQGKPTAYILILDSEQRSTRVLAFVGNERAAENYITLEKENIGKPQIQIVMVSVNSLAALKAAYPSYYLDTDRFLTVVQSIID